MMQKSAGAVLIVAHPDRSDKLAWRGSATTDEEAHGMQINGSNPNMIARAYGVSRPNPAVLGKVTPAAGAGPLKAVDGAAIKPRPEAVSKLVAAVVPGKVDFSGDSPAQLSRGLGAGGTYQMYRRPTDKVEAATVVSLGRSLDIRG